MYNVYPFHSKSRVISGRTPGPSGTVHFGLYGTPDPHPLTGPTPMGVRGESGRVTVNPLSLTVSLSLDSFRSSRVYFFPSPLYLSLSPPLYLLPGRRVRDPLNSRRCW